MRRLAANAKPAQHPTAAATPRAPSSASDPGAFRDCSDAELVTGIRTGDMAALGALFDRYGDAVHDLGLDALGDGPAAARATHRTFVYVAGRAFDLVDPDDVGPWIFAVARASATPPRRAPWTKPPASPAVAPEPTDLGAGVTVRPVAAAPAYLRDTILWDVEDGAAARVHALHAREVRRYERRPGLPSRARGWVGPVAAGVAVFAFVLVLRAGDDRPEVRAGPAPTTGSTATAAPPPATTSIPISGPTTAVAGDEAGDATGEALDRFRDDRATDDTDAGGLDVAGAGTDVAAPAADPWAGPGDLPAPTVPGGATAPTPTTLAPTPTTSRPTPTTRPAPTTTTPPPTTTPTTEPPPTTTPTTEPPPPPEPPPEPPGE